MKFDVLPQTAQEWMALRTHQIPMPIAHTQMSFVIARAVLSAFRFQLFELSRDRAVTVEELAVTAELDARALASLMHILTGLGYFHYARGRYSLTPMARKWCLEDSPHSLCQQQRFNQVCWKWMEYMDEFLQTGRGLQFHEHFSDKDWAAYRRGMEDVARLSVNDATRMLPAPPEPRRMLDIGGAHGFYSAGMCRKYHGLKSTILDFPQAIKRCANRARLSGFANRIEYHAGDALKEPLAKNTYDIVLISSLIQHFSSEQVPKLAHKAAQALKPGGWLVIQEFARPEPTNKIDMTGAAMDLFFNLSSTSGNWSLSELQGFVSGAGLTAHKINRFMAPPGYLQVCGQRPM